MAKPHPLVRVVWTDAESAGDVWERPETCIEWAKKTLTQGETNGRLVFIDKNHLVVYGTLMQECWIHGIKIPRRWVKEIQYLDEPPRSS